MPTSVVDKLSAVIAQIEEFGNADVLRLTVLKKWFERPGRLAEFALWVASRVAERDGKLGESTSDLYGEAQALVRHRAVGGGIDPTAAERLYHRIRSFQNTYRKAKWGPSGSSRTPTS